MINPIPYTGFYPTPENFTELIEICCDLPDYQRVIALKTVFMAMNLAHSLIEKEIQNALHGND